MARSNRGRCCVFAATGSVADIVAIVHIRVENHLTALCAVAYFCFMQPIVVVVAIVNGVGSLTQS